MANQDLESAIIRALQNMDGAVPVEDLRNELKVEYGVDRGKRAIQTRLRDMAEGGAVDRARIKTSGPGRPPYYYFLPTDDMSVSNDPGEIPEFTALSDEEEIVPMELSSRGEVSLQDANSEADQGLPDGVYWDIVEKQLDSSKLVQRIEEAAPDIAELDPLETLLDMVQWTVDQINKLGKRMGELHEKGASGQVRTIRDRYENLAGWARRYFHEFWQLTSFSSHGQNVLRIPEKEEFFDTGKDPRGDIEGAKFDRQKARDHLEGRVFGDRIIERIEISESTTNVVGTDSSVARVSLQNESRLTPETVFELYAGAAALDHDDRRFTDFDFSPANLKEYRQREAFRKGLLLSENALPQLKESQVKKARFAALDLRQYREVMRVVKNDVSWRPHGDVDEQLGDYTGSDLMFMDGRLTPIVHLMSEFHSDDLYGELVRKEMQHFARVAELARKDNWETDTTFAGVVKEPGISWFAPIVFWYLETQHDGDLDQDSDGAIRNVWQPPLSDVVLPHLLFRGLAEANGVPEENESFSTFRVLRRFYDNSIPSRDIPPRGPDDQLIDTESMDGWMSYFERVQERRKSFDRETVDLDTYRKFGFAPACANMGSLMCYAGPPNLYTAHQRNPIRLPRLEVLVNPPRDSKKQMREAISAFALKHYSDDDHSVDGYDRLEEVPVVVPRVIVESDKIAKYARDRISEDVTHDIHETVQDLNSSN
jgi:hypothetical protein